MKDKWVREELLRVEAKLEYWVRYLLGKQVGDSVHGTERMRPKIIGQTTINQTKDVKSQAAIDLVQGTIYNEPTDGKIVKHAPKAKT